LLRNFAYRSGLRAAKLPYILPSAKRRKPPLFSKKAAVTQLFLNWLVLLLGQLFLA